MIRKSFKFYRSYFDVFNELEKDSDKVAFLNAVFQKHFFNKEPELKSQISKLAYKAVQHSINSQVTGFISKYGDIQQDNKTNIQGVAQVLGQEVSHNDNDKENDKGKEKGNIQFVKPSAKQISDYCLERKNDVEANKFYDFYESKGWMVGKNKMKDWRACVRTWESKTPKNQKLKFKEEGNQW